MCRRVKISQQNEWSGLEKVLLSPRWPILKHVSPENIIWHGLFGELNNLTPLSEALICHKYNSLV